MCLLRVASALLSACVLDLVLHVFASLLLICLKVDDDMALFSSPAPMGSPCEDDIASLFASSPRPPLVAYSPSSEPPASDGEGGPRILTSGSE